MRSRRRGVSWDWATGIDRPTLVGIVGTAALLLSVALAPAEYAPRADSHGARQMATERSDGVRRTREGTEMADRHGFFRMTGDRMTFFTLEGRQRFVALENLNLERIARAVANDPDRLTWSVTGTITEFRGANYLLVRRAVIEGRTAREDDLTASH